VADSGVRYIGFIGAIPPDAAVRPFKPFG